MIDIPRVAVLKVQLILNQQLFENGFISQGEYDEVCEMIYTKMHHIK